MENNPFATIKNRLETTQDEIDDIIDEAQQNHHAFISQITSLKRTIRSMQAHIRLNEPSQRSS